MNTINELIHELIKLRDKHGNIQIKNNEIKLEVIGLSFKYLLVKSEMLSIREAVENDVQQQ